jgi:hypothetical protein
VRPQPAPVVEVTVHEAADGWVADVTIEARDRTRHTVRVSRAEHARYGGDVEGLVRRCVAFLLRREPNTAILADFDISTVERFFPDFPDEMAR